MFILNPDIYSLPCYRIGPFKTQDLSVNHLLPESDLIDNYLNERFDGKEFIYTDNGRKSINLALSFFNLKKEDVVTILTTTGNFYISSCVTYEIEKFCKWSRDIVPKTRVIFVNHEFGFPYNNLKELQKYKLPIIEDCAGSFFSSDTLGSTGKVGDFVIYSFPKMFPIQIGGLLVSNYPGRLEYGYRIDTKRLRYIKNVLSHYINLEKSIIQKRLSNYHFLKRNFESIGFPERFKLEQKAVPGVFMFRTNDNNINLPELKKFFYAHGVQCSVFYGEEAFFLPVHQGLTKQDMEYFFEVFNLFVKK